MQISHSECKSIEKRFLNIYPDTIKVKLEISRNIRPSLNRGVLAE